MSSSTSSSSRALPARGVPDLEASTAETATNSADISSSSIDSASPDAIPDVPRILFEDHHLLALYKPPGLVMHAATGHETGLVEWLRNQLARRSGSQKPRHPVSPVHRLDRDTSGVVLFGKTEAALRKMARQFEHGEVEKHYLVLCKGVTHKKGRIDVPLLIRPSPQRIEGKRIEGKRIENTHIDGKQATPDTSTKPKPGHDGEKEEALTLYRRLRYVKGLSLLLVQPRTGRMHQIRRHLRAIGHPVAGDPRWGEVKFNRFLLKFGLKRPFVHAATLSFLHPISGEAVVIKAPLPIGLSSVLTGLKFEPLQGWPGMGDGSEGDAGEIEAGELEASQNMAEPETSDEGLQPVTTPEEV